MDAVRETIWMLISSMPADRRRCCVRSRLMRPGMELNVIFPWRSAWPAGSVLAWAACAKAKKRMRTAMCITNGSARTDRFSWLRRWKSDEYENQYCRCGMENPVTVASGTFGSGEEFSEYVDLNRLGAVTTKGVANVPWAGTRRPARQRSTAA